MTSEDIKHQLIIITHAISCRRLLQKVKRGMESPDCNVSVVDIHLPKFLRMYCPRHAGVKGNVRADRLAGQATIGSGLRLGRLEALRNLRHYLRAQSQGHNTIYRLQERSVERGSARRSFLKGREGTIVDETSIGTISKVSLGETCQKRSGAHMGFSERIVTILN